MRRVRVDVLCGRMDAATPIPPSLLSSVIASVSGELLQEMERPKDIAWKTTSITGRAIRLHNCLYDAWAAVVIFLCVAVVFLSWIDLSPIAARFSS